MTNVEIWQDRISVVSCDHCGEFDVPFDAAHAMNEAYCPSCEREVSNPVTDTDRKGWFYWFCFPGCLPESTAFGPFASYDEAEAEARETHGDDDDDESEDADEN